MIRAIYNGVKSCVRISPYTQISDFFHVSLGLKQGEPLSPLLFIIFINDIKEAVDINNLAEKDLDLL